MMGNFQSLHSELEELADLRAALSLMTWDKEVYMPKGSAGRRAKQIGSLAGMYHHRMLNAIPPLLEKLEQNPGELNFTEQADIREIRIELDKQIKLPNDFVRKISQVGAECQSAWLQARQENDFSLFSGKFTELVDLKRQTSEYIGYSDNPYDCHLDDFHQGMKTRTLETLFDSFKSELGDLIKASRSFPEMDRSFVQHPIEAKDQLAFGKFVVEKLGFDFNIGRQDISEHPFTIPFAPEDVRITTKIFPNDILEMLYFSIHEGGHGIYEQSLPSARYGLPSGTHCSISIHESQSRLYENNIGRSLEFWEYLFPHLAKIFPENLKGKGPEDIFRIVNRVIPTPTRIRSDELNYHNHIILRFELENDMMNGRLEVKDLEDAWSAKVTEYLGIAPTSSREGVLQDIHWSMGNFGYFPTYSLGSFYAAQFMHKAESDIPYLWQEISNGEFSSLKSWLGSNIHQHGQVFLSDELCERITGEPLNVKYFVDMIKKKFALIYDLA